MASKDRCLEVYHTDEFRLDKCTRKYDDACTYQPPVSELTSDLESTDEPVSG